MDYFLVSALPQLTPDSVARRGMDDGPKRGLSFALTLLRQKKKQWAPRVNEFFNQNSAVQHLTWIIHPPCCITAAAKQRSTSRLRICGMQGRGRKTIWVNLGWSMPREKALSIDIKLATRLKKR
jgi:hypothetical protein